MATLTTKAPCDIREYQSSLKVKGSLISILNDKSTPPSVQMARIKSKLESIDRILNPTTLPNDDDSLQSAALDLKCLALHLGEFRCQFARRQVHEHRDLRPLIQERIRIESQWMTIFGLHILCLNILRNYKNKEWLSRNAQCIYFSLVILKNLCIGQSEVNINKLLDDTKDELLPIVLDIMNGALSWIEEMICCELLGFLLIYGREIKTWTDLVDSHGLNVVQLLIKSCCNCMKLPYFHETLIDQIVPFGQKSHRIDRNTRHFGWPKKSIPFGYPRSFLSYQVGIVNLYQPINQNMTRGDKRNASTYMRSQIASQDDESKSLHALAVNCRMETLKLLVVLTSKYQFEHEFVTKLLCPIPTVFWKRLLQISTLTMRQGCDPCV